MGLISLRPVALVGNGRAARQHRQLVSASQPFGEIIVIKADDSPFLDWGGPNQRSARVRKINAQGRRGLTAAKGLSVSAEAYADKGSTTIGTSVVEGCQAERAAIKGPERLHNYVFMVRSISAASLLLLVFSIFGLFYTLLNWHLEMIPPAFLGSIVFSIVFFVSLRLLTSDQID